MTDRELMQQALEALVDYVEEYGPHEKDSGAAYIVTALRDRLAQPEQEPMLTVDALRERLAQPEQDAVLAEREACAQLCEKYGFDNHCGTTTDAIAAAIRARGQDPMPLFDDWPGGWRK